MKNKNWQEDGIYMVSEADLKKLGIEECVKRLNKAELKRDLITAKFVLRHEGTKTLKHGLEEEILGRRAEVDWSEEELKEMMADVDRNGVKQPLSKMNLRELLNELWDELCCSDVTHKSGIEKESVEIFEETIERIAKNS